jgi:hypothetical protein
MPKPLVVVALTLALAPALTAQGRGMGGMAGMADPTNVIHGSGTLPSGWMLRFDPPRRGQPEHQMTEINFVTMGTGFHLNSGPAALYYRSADMATGDYTVSATISQAKSMVHETYGLFIAGHNLQDSTQNYLYFVVRPMDGIVLINHRTSNAPPTKLLPDSTRSAAVHVESKTDGSASNTISIRVSRDSVFFMANGQQVKAIAKSQIPNLDTNGLVGLRLNHNLDVHIADFALKKG